MLAVDAEGGCFELAAIGEQDGGLAAERRGLRHNPAVGPDDPAPGGVFAIAENADRGLSRRLDNLTKRLADLRAIGEPPARNEQAVQAEGVLQLAGNASR